MRLASDINRLEPSAFLGMFETLTYYILYVCRHLKYMMTTENMDLNFYEQWVHAMITVL